MIYYQLNDECLFLNRYPKLEEALALPLNFEEPLVAAELSTPTNIEARSRGSLSSLLFFFFLIFVIIIIIIY